MRLDRFRLGGGARPLLGPRLSGRTRIGRESPDGSFRCHDGADVRHVDDLQRLGLGHHLSFLLGEIALAAGCQTFQLGVGGGDTFAQDAAHRIFRSALRRGLVVELLLQRRHPRQGGGVGEDLRHGGAGVLDGQPHHRDHVGDDQDDVLGQLRPGHGPHAAEEGAYKDAGEADEHADAELEAGEAAGDDADAVNLRHHVGEGAGNRDNDADETRQVAAVAGAEEIRNGELAELAQVGREKQRHQAVAAGPAHDESQAVEPGVVERAGHADETRRRHPVGARCHAVEDGRHAPPCDVVFGHFRRLRHEADAGIQQDGGEEEDVAEDARLHAEPLEATDQEDEHEETARVEAVVFFKLGVEAGLPRRHAYSRASWAPSSSSSLFWWCA